ncbi:MAG: DnaJ domain-containing protein [Janthinobacterium lividum]
MKDFYAMLATDVNCNQVEIQEAYESFLKTFPAVSGQNSRQFKNQFKDIRQAYEVLSDPEKRRQYDQQFKKIHQPKQQYYTKAIDLTFTIVLIFFTIVFGDYVFTSIHQAKAAKTHKAAVKVAALHQLKLHKKGQLAKTKTLDYTANISSHVVKTDSIMEPPIIDQAISDNKNSESGNDLNLDKNTSAPDNVNNDHKADDNAGYLYTTDLKANETGKINLRKTGSYNADIIQVIPTGSKVFVLEKGSVYYKVQFENSIGYVPKWTLALK